VIDDALSEAYLLKQYYTPVSFTRKYPLTKKIEMFWFFLNRLVAEMKKMSHFKLALK